MSNRNNQIVETLLSVLSKELGMSMDDLRMRCDVDEVALEVDRYIAEHPEEFGMAAKPDVNSDEEIDLDSFADSVNRFGDEPPESLLDPLLVPIPEPEQLSFLIDFDAIFPFYDDEVSLNFDEYNGRLFISTVIPLENDFSDERQAAVEKFMSQSALSNIVSLEDDGCSVIISTECDVNNLCQIREIFAGWLDILRNDMWFMGTMENILNL